MIKNAGTHNTEEALRQAALAAGEWDVKHIVVASTSGDTALKALDVVSGADLKLVVVTHSTGFAKPGVQEFSEDTRKKIVDAGHCVHTGMHLLRGVGKAIKKRIGSSEEELVANTLRIFGQGMKVAVEIAAMATDSGLVPCPGNIISVGGTARGADTVILVGTAPSHDFFDMKIRKVIAKPIEF